MRIYKSIFSSRSDLKQLNTETQNYLINTMEPLLSLGMAYGLKYPVETVREIWRLMFENAAHDSIGACVSDTTNEDVYMRYKQVRDIASNLVELTLREIATRIGNPQSKEIPLTFFNPLSTVQNGVVEVECYVPQKEFGILDEQGNEIAYTILEFVDQTEYVLNQGNILDLSKDIFIPNKVYKAKIALQLNDVPSVGYVQYTIDLHRNTLTELIEQKREILENEALQITINDNGSLDILDKKTATTYRNQTILEENGDDGHSFNYSPPRNDLKIQSIEFKPVIKVVNSAILEVATITYEMIVPKDLEERAEGIQSTRLPVTIVVKLAKGQSTIDFEVAIDNRWVDSHRLCALFDAGIASKVSTADQQFGLIQRPVVRRSEMDLWQSDQEKWNEKPLSIETCQSFVTLNDAQKGIAIFPKGVREYEIVGEKYDTIRLTLFRTYGYMGKENLVYRPGRASGESVVKTPNSQCHKQLKFSFSAYYYQGNVNSGEVANSAKIANTRPLVYEYADFLNSRLIFTQSEVQKDLFVSDSLFKTNGHLTLSVIKKAEERPGMIVRLYNGHVDDELDDTIMFEKTITKAELVDLKEETIGALEVYSNTIKVPTQKHAKFVTVYVEF
ncbi:MAG: glycoside hydrolase family 38 C-terminal domain-containing protein [Latilactobacillus curvatus]